MTELNNSTRHKLHEATRECCYWTVTAGVLASAREIVILTLSAGSTSLGWVRLAMQELTRDLAQIAHVGRLQCGEQLTDHL